MQFEQCLRYDLFIFLLLFVRQKEKKACFWRRKNE